MQGKEGELCGDVERNWEVTQQKRQTDFYLDKSEKRRQIDRQDEGRRQVGREEGRGGRVRKEVETREH